MFICGNWKAACKTATFDNVKALRRDQFISTDAVITVPSIYIPLARMNFPDFIKIGAQDISRYTSGPYTGEVTGEMLNEYGISYVLVGHSERRIMLNESNTDVAEKISRCIEFQLAPIICIGETQACRESHGYLDYLWKQLKESVGNHTDIKADVAYEPVWAIGSGQNASNCQIAEVTRNVKTWMAKLGLHGRILYGGSVNESNIDDIIALDSVDGVLVGNAAITDEFGRIAKRMRCGS